MTKAFMKKESCDQKKAIKPNKTDCCCCSDKAQETIKECACKKHVTEIIAEYDVGFGNFMFIRGEGCKCLNWDKGVVMTNVGANQWKFVCESDSEKKEIEFKLLINDEFWSEGENMKAECCKINHVIAKF